MSNDFIKDIIDEYSDWLKLISEIRYNQIFINEEYTDARNILDSLTETLSTLGINCKKIKEELHDRSKKH